MEEYLVNSKDLDGFLKIEKDLSEDKGEVCLVVCLKPKGEDYFDLFIAADWVAKNDINTYMENVEFVGSLLDKYLPVEINTQISTIILLNSAEIFVKDFLAQIHKESSPCILKELEINGFKIEQAYIFKPTPRAKSLNERLISLLEQLPEEQQEQLIFLLEQLPEEQQEQLISLLEQIPEEQQEQLISLLKQPPEGQQIREPIKNNVIDAKERFSKDNRVSQEDKFQNRG